MKSQEQEEQQEQQQEPLFWGSPGKSSLEASQGQETAREDQGRSGKAQGSESHLTSSSKDGRRPQISDFRTDLKLIEDDLVTWWPGQDLRLMEDDILNPLITFGQRLNTECSCFKINCLLWPFQAPICTLSWKIWQGGVDSLPPVLSGLRLSYTSGKVGDFMVSNESPWPYGHRHKNPLHLYFIC